MSTVIAARYAKALYELGRDGGALDSLVHEINVLAELYGSNDELRSALENPLVPHPARKAILTEIASRLELNPLVKNAVLLLSDRMRLRILPALARHLREMVDHDKGLIRAEIITAVPLGDAYYAKLKEQLETMTGKQVTLECREDPTLIAGVVTRLGDTVYDGSLKARLESLKLALIPN